MQASLGGAAKIQGVGSVAGLSNSSPPMNPAVKCAVWIWIGALAVLVIFHVGGAHI